jgi:hypothetical protein
MDRHLVEHHNFGGLSATTASIRDMEELGIMIVAEVHEFGHSLTVLVAKITEETVGLRILLKPFADLLYPTQILEARELIRRSLIKISNELITSRQVLF